jgi:hypothetical protein
LLEAAPTAAGAPGPVNATDSGPIVLSGQGPDPGRPVSPGDGPAIFTVAHRGRQRFRVTLLDEGGQPLDVVAAGAGAYTYVCAVHESGGMVGTIAVTRRDS